MNYSRPSVRTDVYLHPKVFSPAASMMLASTIVPSRSRSPGLQMTVDLLEQTLPQLVLFQQMTDIVVCPAPQYELDSMSSIPGSEVGARSVSAASPVGISRYFVNDQELGTGRSRNNQDL